MPLTKPRRWSRRTVVLAMSALCAIALEIMVFTKYSEIPGIWAEVAAGLGVVLFGLAWWMWALRPSE